MNNLLSYCGLVDAKIRASDKDLPVQSKNSAPPPHIFGPSDASEKSLANELWHMKKVCPKSLPLTHTAYISVASVVEI